MLLVPAPLDSSVVAVLESVGTLTLVSKVVAVLLSVGTTPVLSTPLLVKLPPVGLFSVVESIGSELVVTVINPLVKLGGNVKVYISLEL